MTFLTTITRALFAATLVATACGPLAAATCPKGCAAVSGGVVHAAGVPGLTKALEAIEFQGNGLAPNSAAAVAALAAEIKKLPAGKAIAIAVAADDGVQGRAARTQARARAKSLAHALQEAGVPASKAKVSAGPQSGA